MEKINTIIVPLLNYEGYRKTLESIRKHTPPNFYLIAIDQWQEPRQDINDLVDLHIITGGKNLGYAKCFNTGIRLSDTKYVSIWNDDCECINKRWWDGVQETFDKYETALCVNPSSPRNPRAAGEAPINAPGVEYKEEFSEEEYDKLLEAGKGHVIDGICMFATIFDREKLNKVAGTVPGSWMDEWFYPGGGEDYDMNRRAYLTRNEDNNLRGYRCLGTSLAFVWHWWYSTKRTSDGVAGVKHCGNQWPDKWGIDADIYGKTGKQLVPHNIIRPLDQC